ncbi:hypothetical protein BDY17DRAFT_144663 [Neohortaea acidophila]|uniref:Zn(2)-C6 fungal-type domain-containing protein n=1 Tax=Neohortaea acidophila TaxID=245834 RepID=A0A6A6PT51_9PEZI|nr:uncharacterized protein BDY17DRAFT_144663 [Neohortaea acidophila]KAF2483280.1 hypothetical protein BDY17DRAFT_144663 [Neohortaea acidophila]
MVPVSNDIHRVDIHKVDAAKPPSQVDRRRRVVFGRLGHDYCRTCRYVNPRAEPEASLRQRRTLTERSRRRVKCDRTRPYCQRCQAHGRQCEGYSSWELDINPLPVSEHATVPATAEDAYLPVEIANGSMNQAQLLSTFLTDRFADTSLAADPTPHLPRTSIPHLWATTSMSAPLVQHALNTICLEHFAAKTSSRVHIEYALASRGNVLRMLQHALIAPFCHPRDIVLTLMIMSFTSPVGNDTGASRIHVEGALQYLTCREPATFDGNEHLHLVLMRHLRPFALHCGMAQRKEIVFRHPAWARLPRKLGEDDARVYKAACWLPKDADSTKVFRWQQPDLFSDGAAGRNIPRDVVNSLPSLLEKTDEFLTQDANGTPKLSFAAATSLVRRFDNIQKSSVLPSKVEAGANRVSIRNNDIDSFRMDVQAHYYLYSTTFVREHYTFEIPTSAYTSVTVSAFGLLVDCALLQIISHGMTRYGLPADWTGVSRRDVEQRAYQAAYEVCQHVHFYSQRGLTAARIMSIWVTYARNFFDSYGAEVEREWCNGCLEAIASRIRQLEATSYSLCPMIDILDRISGSFRYQRPPGDDTWKTRAWPFR